MSTTPSHWGAIAGALPRLWAACQEADDLNEASRLMPPVEDFEAKFDAVAAYNLSARTIERIGVRCGDIMRPLSIRQLALYQHRQSAVILRVGTHDERGRVKRDLRDSELGPVLTRFRDQQPLLPGMEESVNLWFGMGPQFKDVPRPVFLAEYQGVDPVHIYTLTTPDIATRSGAWEAAGSNDAIHLEVKRMA